MAKKKDEVPSWVTDEIQNAKFEKPQSLIRTGYILEIYDDDGKIDAQFYEPVEDGRHIITLDLPPKIKTSGLEKGVVCEFNFESLKAPLSKKVSDFLKKEKEIDMNAIYQFKLKKLEQLDEGSSEPANDLEE